METFCKVMFGIGIILIFFGIIWGIVFRNLLWAALAGMAISTICAEILEKDEKNT
jgi:hypothetical protein